VGKRGRCVLLDTSADRTADRAGGRGSSPPAEELTSAEIEFKEDQLPALDAQQQPAVAIDPRTGQEYLLIRREVYEKVRLFLKPFARGWDNPDDDDLIRKDL